MSMALAREVIKQLVKENGVSGPLRGSEWVVLIQATEKGKNLPYSHIMNCLNVDYLNGTGLLEKTGKGSYQVRGLEPVARKEPGMINVGEYIVPRPKPLNVDELPTPEARAKMAPVEGETFDSYRKRNEGFEMRSCGREVRVCYHGGQCYFAEKCGAAAHGYHGGATSFVEVKYA